MGSRNVKQQQRQRKKQPKMKSNRVFLQYSLAQPRAAIVMRREIDSTPATTARGALSDMVSVEAVPNDDGTASEVFSQSAVDEPSQPSTSLKPTRFGRANRVRREKPIANLSASGNVNIAEIDEDEAQRKQATWATAFKRHATALTAQFLQLRQPPSKPRLTTQAEFRREFLKRSRDRLIKDCKGTCFRMYPIMMNGDCGFASIAKGINIAREKTNLNVTTASSTILTPDSTPTSHRNPATILASGQTSARAVGREPTSAPAPSPSPPSSPTQPTSPTSPPAKPRASRRRRLRQFLWWRRAPPVTKRLLQAKDVRTAMFAEIRRAKKTYLADKKYESFYSEEDMDRLVERLEREVSRQGIGGHWLGTVLDQLEYIIVAHAMNVNLYLYQFDLKTQAVVPFDNAIVDNAHCDVYLFFTGPPGSGHFDTLVKITDAPETRTDTAVTDRTNVNDVTTVDDVTTVNDIATVNNITTINDVTLVDDTSSINDAVSVNDAATVMSI